MNRKILLTIGFLLLLAMPAAADPIENLTPPAYTGINVSNWTFEWNPEHGYYTRWWFDPSNDWINPYGFFYSLLLPIMAILGTWTFLIIWGAVCMALYIYTQDSTMPFVVGLLIGSIMSVLMDANALMVMTLTMCFLGGGILAKTLLGRT